MKSLVPLPQQFGECQDLLFSPSFTVWLDAHHHVEVSAKGQKMSRKRMDEDIQEPSFIRPHGAVPKRKKAPCPASSDRPHHGENFDIVPKLKEVPVGGISLEVCNDLQVAIEVNSGTGWRVMYPEERFRLDTLQSVDVAARLRDDPDICGTCCVDATALLRAKEAFGHFGPAAVEFSEAEQREVEHERQLQEARVQKLTIAVLGHRPPRDVWEEKDICAGTTLLALVGVVGACDVYFDNLGRCWQ